MQRYNINNRLAYLSGGVQSRGGMWPSVAAGDWWDVSGETVVAAWQAVGAASQAASYSNLANPGTYDLGQHSAVAVPDWSSSAGWTYDGTGQALKSSASSSLKPLTYIARIKTASTTGYRTVIGSLTSNTGFSLDLTPTTNLPRFLKMMVALIGAGTSGFSNSTDTVIAVTYDASGNYVHYLNGSANGSGTNNQTASAGSIVLGAQALNIGVADWQRFNGDILAVAIYSTVLDSTQISSLSTAMSALS